MDSHNWSGILVYLESEAGIIDEIGYQLMSIAEILSQQLEEDIYGVVIDSNLAGIKEQLLRCPAKKVYLYQTQAWFVAEVHERCMAECIEEVHPAIVLIGGTDKGRAFASRIAVRFRTGVTADCTELSLDEKGNLIQTRPAFGGNIMASIMTEQTRPQIATIREGTYEKHHISKVCPTKFYEKTIHTGILPSKLIKKYTKKEVESITTQEVLVVAGRGVKQKEDLEMLKQLAEVLGGKLASSRALVEKGWTKPSQQIGLSGNCVAPKLMLTFGVSGTVQFMAGMKRTKNIIAVNTDPNARIFDIAHYPIVGDLYEVLPQLLDNLKGSKEL